MPTDQEARAHLGRLLAARRVELDPRYRNRRTFAADTGMGWRTLYDVEMARRDNFTSGTLRAFESAYRLASGSLDRFAGDLEPLPADAPRLAAVPGPVPPGAEVSALDRIGVLMASATPTELEMLDAMVAVIIEGDEVAEGLWRFPDPKGPEGRLLPRDTRLSFIRTWLADDPRRALDDEGRQGTGTA